MKKKILSILLSIIMVIGIVPSFSITAFAADYATELRSKGFPESYIPDLVQLHNKYPKWKFEALDTGVNWSTAVANERTPHWQQNIQMTSSNASRNFYCKCADCYKYGKYVIREGSTWVAASQSAVEFYLDPRNFLDETYIFQFESTGYNSAHTQAGVESIIANTWMKNANITYKDANGSNHTYSTQTKYSKAIMDAAKASGMGAYYLASKIVQEVGGKTNSAGGASGTYSDYPGIYNYYNIGANTGAKDGLRWASAKQSGEWVTNTTNVRVRRGPSTSTAEVIRVPDSGTAVTYISTTDIQADGYRWVEIKVSVGGTTYTGYIRRDLLNRNYNRPWSNPYLSIYNGAFWIADNYITQNTGYLQKFNVNPASGSNMYAHEYMANVQAAASEASNTYKGYKNSGELANAKTFYIPVFVNMPGDDSVSTSIPKVEGVSSNAFGNSVDLSWKAVSNVNGYQIQVLVNGLITSSVNSSTASALIKQLEPGTEYTFKIRAYQYKNSKYTYSAYWSDPFTIKTPTADEALASMPKVQNVKLTNTTPTTVDISYDEIKGASLYQIQISKDNGSSWSVAMNTGYTSRTLTNLDPSVTYLVRVAGGIKQNGAGRYSANWSDTGHFSTKPEQVTNLRTTWRSSNGDRIKLAWNAQPKADGYKIYQLINSSWKVIDTVKGGENREYIVYNLTPNKNYSFRVRAYKGGEGNLGGYSNTHETYTFPNYSSTLGTLGIVKNVKLTNTTPTTVDISYDKVNGAQLYKIQISEDGTTWRDAMNTGYTSRTLTNLAPSTTYYVRVTAGIKANGVTPMYDTKWSDTGHFYTKPEQVSNLRTTWRSTNGDRIKLAWNAQPKADGYKIYQLINSSWKVIDTVKGGENWEYIVYNLTPNKNYSFRVRAYKGGEGNLGGNSNTHETYTYPDYANGVLAKLTKVQNIKLTNSTSTTVDISYDKVNGAQLYKIQISEDGITWRDAMNTGYTSRTLTNLAPSTGYYVRVAAGIKINGVTPLYGTNWSETYHFNTKPTQITGLKFLAGSADGTKLVLTWNAQPNADGYVIYKKGVDQWWKLATVKGSNNNTYTAEGLTPTYQYTYMVRAYKGGEGNLGAAAQISLYALSKQPKIESAVSNASKQITVRWSGDFCHGYEVMWSTSPDFSSNIKSVDVGSSSTSATIATAQSKITYYVRVRSYCTRAGERISGVWSETLSVQVK